MFMPFGKHRGRLLEDVPHSYLLWVLDNCRTISPTLRREIERVLGMNQQRSRPQPQRIGAAVINEWYRTLAKEFHPDLKGTHEAMKAVNRAKELMLELLGS
jgi:hypothetical protein